MESLKTGTKSLKIKKLLKVAKSCANCGWPLIKTHSRRNLQDLTQNYFIDSEIGRCNNAACGCKDLRLYPSEYRELIYPKSDYSLSVYAEVGYLRLKELKSVSQIAFYMKEHYPDLHLRERSIENIYKRVLVCLRQRQEDKEVLKEKLAKKGVTKLCLTLDGIAPERGNSILYVVREVESQEIIFVRYLEHSDIAHLKAELFEPLKAFLEEVDLDLGGWLCDKQNGFIAAIESVFEGVPIHLCQAHFLKAMAKPVKSADSEMGKEIKKKLRPLKQIEKDLADPEISAEYPLTDQQKEALSTLCLLPRTWISRSISVEYDLRGTQMYEQFDSAIKAIKKMEKKQEHPLLERLKTMLVNSIKEEKSKYRDLTKAHKFLAKLSDILYGERKEVTDSKQLLRLSEEHRKANSPQHIQQQIEQLIADFKQANKTDSTLCREIIRNFETTYDNWKSNIFTCYEHDFIPNDNNSLEANHNSVKRELRKTTGNKSTAQPLLIYGEDFVLSQSFHDLSSKDLHLVLANVDFTKVAIRQKQLKKEQQKRGLKIRVVNRTAEVLKKVYDDW